MEVVPGFGSPPNPRSKARDTPKQGADPSPVLVPNRISRVSPHTLERIPASALTLRLPLEFSDREVMLCTQRVAILFALLTSLPLARASDDFRAVCVAYKIDYESLFSLKEAQILKEFKPGQTLTETQAAEILYSWQLQREAVKLAPPADRRKALERLRDVTIGTPSLAKRETILKAQLELERTGLTKLLAERVHGPGAQLSDHELKELQAASARLRPGAIKRLKDVLKPRLTVFKLTDQELEKVASDVIDSGSLKALDNLEAKLNSDPRIRVSAAGRTAWLITTRVAMGSFVLGLLIEAKQALIDPTAAARYISDPPPEEEGQQGNGDTRVTPTETPLEAKTRALNETAEGIARMAVEDGKPASLFYDRVGNLRPPELWPDEAKDEKKEFKRLKEGIEETYNQDPELFLKAYGR